MFGLDNVFNALRSIPFWIADLGVGVFNAFIFAVGTIIGAIFGLLPGFPPAPEMPGGITGAFLWIVPVAPIAAGMSAITTSFMIFLGYRTLMKWVKA